LLVAPGGAPIAEDVNHPAVLGEEGGNVDGIGECVLAHASIARSNPCTAGVTGGRDETRDACSESFVRRGLQVPFDPFMELASHLAIHNGRGLYLHPAYALK
jgi:hypothetical protein